MGFIEVQYSTACHYCPQWINQLTHLSASQSQWGLLKFSLGADVSPVGTTWGSCISRHTCFSEHALFLETALISGGWDCHLLGLEHKRLHAGRLFWATPGDNIITPNDKNMNKHMWGGLKTKITLIIMTANLCSLIDSFPNVCIYYTKKRMYVKVWNFNAAMLLEKRIVFLSLIFHWIPVSATTYMKMQPALGWRQQISNEK